MPDGQGLKKLYPPLAGSDYLRDAPLDSVVCLILNGHTGGITVNGIRYNEVMPAFPELKPAELSNLLNYIRTHWENDLGELNPEAVEAAHQRCFER